MSNDKNMNENIISFVTDDGEQVLLEILEQTTIAGCNYLLVADQLDEDMSENEEPQAYIMKEVVLSDESDSDKEGVAAYEFVEDEQELASISKIFEELLEDTDLV